MTRHFLLPALLLAIAGKALATGNLQLYLPFDGDCRPAAAPAEVTPTLRGQAPVFQGGIRGQALVIGGKGSGVITYPFKECFNPARGTVAFWVQAVDWDATEPAGTTFFNFLPHAYLYKYGGFEDTMSFYCKFPDYGNYILYSTPLPLRRGQWHHVGVTWLDDVLTLYADGKLGGQYLLREPLRTEWESQGLQFGCPYGDNHTRLDEFYLLDYPLTPAQMARVYESGRNGGAPEFPADRASRLYTVHYPGVKKVLVYADASRAAYKDQVGEAVLEAADARDRRYPLGTIRTFSGGIGKDLLVLPAEVAAGPVRVTAVLRDKSGGKLEDVQSEPFEKRVYPWEGADSGVSDDVFAPFTPQTVSGRNIACWGREYTFGKDGWPEKIVTRGRQILTAPVRLEAEVNGAKVDWGRRRFELLGRLPGKTSFRSGAEGRGGRFELDGTMEFDGMVKYTLRFTPDAGAAVQQLTLSLPLKAEHALLYHACRDQIRATNEAGYVPKGAGKVWGSSAKKNQMVRGTFLPYFWLGDYDRGFCWMADSDRGWTVPDDQDCVEFIRDGGTLTAKVHVIRRETRLERPLEITFALMAGPARPEPAGWRLDPYGSSWFCGHTPTLQGYGKPPYWDKYVADVKSYKKDWGFWGVNTSPNDFWDVTEENDYFQLEWRGGTTNGYPLKQRNDFVMDTLDRLMQAGYIDGLYSDDVYPQVSYNQVTGRGFRRADGLVQAGYSMFALRDFYKRAAFLFRKHQCSRRMMVHMTDSMIMPCYAFWDIKHDNEWGEDRMKQPIESFGLGELCARTMSRQYGMAASWHTLSDWNTNPDTGGDDHACLLLLHDVLGRSAMLEPRTRKAKELFGIGQGDVEFLGYWRLQPDRDPEKKDVKVSAWVRKPQRTALVVVANLTADDWQGSLKLPLADMGLKKGAVACDGEDLSFSGIPLHSGILELAVPRHNYRIVLIGAPGVFPRDLPPPGTALGKPREIIPSLCDDFNGPELASAWKLVHTPLMDSRLRVYRQRLMVLGTDYRMTAAERRLGEDNVTVQARVESMNYMQNSVGLLLQWENGNGVFAGPLLNDSRKAFQYYARIGGKKQAQWGSPVNLDNPRTVYQCNWVKITLTPAKILFFGSADGKTWKKDWELNRSQELAGAPAVLRLGKSPGGDDLKHAGSPVPDFFDDLIVGRD